MKVLLALDGSATGGSAATAIADWARESRAEVMLLMVLKPGEVHETVAGGGYTHTLTPQGTQSGQMLRGVSGPSQRTAEDRTQALTRHHAERLDYLESLAKSVLHDVVTTAAVEDHEDIATAIIEAAERTGANIIAMATRSRSPLGQALFGAIHEEVVRQSPVPVLLVGPGARKLHGAIDVGSGPTAG